MSKFDLENNSSVNKESGNQTLQCALSALPAFAPAQDRLFYTLPDGTTVEEIGAFDKDVVGTLKRIGVSRPDNGAWACSVSPSARRSTTSRW